MTEPAEASEGAPTEARTWATVCHLAAFLAFIGIPFGNILGPLVVWLIKRNDHPFVDDQGREAVNFQITVFLYAIVLVVVLIAAAAIEATALFFVLIALGIVVGIFFIAAPIVAAIRSNRGVRYRYPATLRLLR